MVANLHKFTKIHQTIQLQWMNCKLHFKKVVFKNWTNSGIEFADLNSYLFHQF